jgi:endonuclease YncB( thermonuclease family)
MQETLIGNLRIMAINKEKITALVAERAIEILNKDFIEDLEPDWPITYNEAIHKAFIELQEMAKAMGSSLRSYDFNHEQAWTLIQQSRQCR